MEESMAIRTIRLDGDEILRKKSKVVDKIDDKICTLLDDMVETMYDSNGVGLAAPQIGILKRIVVIDAGDGLIELINPEIVGSSGVQVCQEGCLSIPGYFGDVERPAKVKIKALNRKGEEAIYEGTKLLAVAMCHELDHLDGILFKDKATNMEKVR
jgi:peptide deformylase